MGILITNLLLLSEIFVDAMVDKAFVGLGTSFLSGGRLQIESFVVVVIINERGAHAVPKPIMQVIPNKPQI